MHEQTLRDFFIGKVSAAELTKDLTGSRVATSPPGKLPVESNIQIVDMESEFEITRPMLVALCDAVLSGKFPPEELATVGFALQASEHFTWDGDADDLLPAVIEDWSSPEINYPLTLENVQGFKMWLAGEEAYPARPTLRRPGGGGDVLVSVTKKQSIKPWWKRLAPWSK